MSIVSSPITAPMAASALSALLAFMPNPLLSQIGLAGSMGLGGYAIATAKANPRRQKQARGMSTDRQVRSLKQELADVQTRIRTLSRDKKQLAIELSQVQTARAGLIAKVKALELAVGDKAATPAIDICEYTKQLQSLKSAIADKDAQLSELSTALAAANDGMAERIAKVKADTLLTGSARLELEGEVEQLTEDKQKLSAAYKSLNTALENAGLKYDAELSDLGGIKEASDEQALAAIHHWKKQAAVLTARIAELEAEAKKPGRFGGLGAADVMGNRLIDFLADNGVLMSAVETDPNPDKGLLVTLKPTSHTSSIEVKNLMPRCESSLSLHSLPTVSLDNGNYHYRLAVDPLKNTPQTAKLESNLKQLENAVDMANHLRIVGSTGSGKSTALDNLIWLGRCLWPDSRMELFDPKYPASEWSSLEPNYKGPTETIEGIESLSETMENMRLEAVSIVEAGGKFPDFSPLIFAIDEAKEAYREAKKVDRREGRNSKMAVTFSDNLASTLSLGRAYKVKGYFLSQSLLCSKVGLNNDDFDNATSIFLNGMIDKAIIDELKDIFLKDELAAITKELERRRAQGQAYIALVADTDTRLLFLCEMPRPGFYHDRYESENGVAVSGSETPFHTVTRSDVKTREPLQDNSAEPMRNIHAEEPVTPVHTDDLVAITLPRAKCPSCSEGSTKLNSQKVQKNGKRRFICQNAGCDKKTFSALPE